MARTAQPILITSILAAAALARLRFVGLDGDVCGANAKALGVASVNASLGEMASVEVAGILLVESGGVIAAEAPITSDAAGKAVAAAAVAVAVAVPAGAVAVLSDGVQPDLTETITGGFLPQAINGYALDAASGPGEIIRILRV